jgi:hypothetical protein
MTRQTFSCTAMSTRIDTSTANANAAPSRAVNVVVWVMNPGPMAEVAIRNIAPSTAPRLVAEPITAFVLSDMCSPSPSLVSVRIVQRSDKRDGSSRPH